VDVRPDTLNLDEKLVAERVGPRTKAIVALHYAGVACEMDELGRIARGAGASLVEDAAHALFGSYRGRALGSIGRLATLSFHETKNVSCGEGGALLVNDPALVERAEILREKGTNRSRFFRGEIDKYTWVDLGSSWLPSEVLAAYLWAQLEARERIQRARERVWRRYRDGLDAWARSHDVRLPVLPPHCGPAWHMFQLVLPSLAARERLTGHLRARGIMAVFHYLPLHLSPMGRRLGGRPGDCPVSEDVSDRLLRLPFYNELDEAAQGEVIDAVQAFDEF
jgi:dTDP-4-amino-4,6-dideoxygalactose transaminase